MKLNVFSSKQPVVDSTVLERRTVGVGRGGNEEVRWRRGGVTALAWGLYRQCSYPLRSRCSSRPGKRVCLNQVSRLK